MTDLGEAFEQTFGIPEGSVIVSRERLGEALHTLFARLPDMLEENADSMPIMARASLPVVRMLMAGEEMQNTLTSDVLVDYVWKVLQECAVKEA